MSETDKNITDNTTEEVDWDEVVKKPVNEGDNASSAESKETEATGADGTASEAEEKITVSDENETSDDNADEDTSADEEEDTDIDVDAAVEEDAVEEAEETSIDSSEATEEVIEEEKPKKAKKKKAETEEVKLSPKEERRLIRQKKRRKARLIAFLVLFVVLAIVGVGGYFGIGAAVDTINDKIEEAHEAEEIENEIIEETATEETAVIDMTPEIIEEPEEEIEEETEPEEPEQTKDELLDEMVETMIAEMSLEDKVAGLFIVSPEILTGQSNVTKAGDGTKAALEQYAVGGIIYDKQNVKSADQLKEMIDNSVEFCKYPMFIGISEEAGKNATVQSALKLESTASAKELGEEDNTITTYDEYKAIGGYLLENGFNLNTSLSADMEIENGISLGDNSFGTDDERVSAMVANAINGMKEAGITTCIKSFPGQGAANADAHTSLAESSKSKAEIEEFELKPFEAAIEAGVDMIMVGHFSAPKITEDSMPCSMSKAIMTDLLRNEMEYDGVIITDVMNVSAITEYYGADEVAVKAIKAGADMVVCPENLELAYNAVVEAVKNGNIDERRIDDSLARVYKIKYRDTLQ